MQVQRTRFFNLLAQNNSIRFDMPKSVNQFGGNITCDIWLTPRASDQNTLPEKIGFFQNYHRWDDRLSATDGNYDLGFTGCIDKCLSVRFQLTCFEEKFNGISLISFLFLKNIT